MNTPKSSPLAADAATVAAVSKRDLFLAFLIVGMTSLGGVLPWARRMLVEQRRWLNDREFTEMLSLGQVLPGPNVVNLSIMVGVRFQGRTGAALAIAGLLLPPLAVLMLLATFYAGYGHIPAVQRALSGMAAVTAGMVLAMGLSMVARQPRTVQALGVSALAFAGSGLLGLPLIKVLLVLAPLSIVLAWRKVP
ncbi:chromate transporter [Oxalobacteraceae bacterium OM1]|nr:chromate transporter [Oxalobacteraceae bacterium OM1]